VNAATDFPVFYDCEASCLGGLPIEIGWSFVDPSSGEIQSEAHLIKPPPHWDMKPVWDPDAEKLHGITLRELIRDGKSPREIAVRMNQFLTGRVLYADSPVDDERWLKLLFSEAATEPSFGTSPLNADLLAAQLAATLGWDTARYENAKVEAALVSPKRHRAEADARYWAALWLRIRGR
jgi:hypothetical protein